MGAALYTLWFEIAVYLFYSHRFIFVLLGILDIYLFTKWNRSPAIRVFAILLALFLVGIVVWWILFWRLSSISP